MRRDFWKIVAVSALSVAAVFVVAACAPKTSQIEAAIASVVEITIEVNTEVKNEGTGFCVRDDKTILSAAHLFENLDASAKISGETLNGKTFDLELISSDAATDVAVLKLKSGSLEPLRFSEAAPRNLDEVTAIGNSRGYGLAFNRGIVSMSEKTFRVNGAEKTVMQTNLTINPGDSGAPVLNAAAEVVGMLSFKLADGNGVGVDGIGFAALLKDLTEIAGKSVAASKRRGRAPGESEFKKFIRKKRKSTLNPLTIGFRFGIILKSHEWDDVGSYRSGGEFTPTRAEARPLRLTRKRRKRLIKKVRRDTHGSVEPELGKFLGGHTNGRSKDQNQVKSL